MTSLRKLKIFLSNTALKPYARAFAPSFICTAPAMPERRRHVNQKLSRKKSRNSRYTTSPGFKSELFFLRLAPPTKRARPRSQGNIEAPKCCTSAQRMHLAALYKKNRTWNCSDRFSGIQKSKITQNRACLEISTSGTMTSAKIFFFSATPKKAYVNGCAPSLFCTTPAMR